MGLNDTKHEHPSYGMANFHRVSNSAGGYLFGSSVTQHFHTIRLAISPGYSLVDECGEQRFRSDLGTQIVEVEFSAAQFCEAITAMNIGDGVPCTIRRCGGKFVESPPKPVSETERSHAAFEDRMAAFGKRMGKLVTRVREVTDAKGLTQKVRDEIRGAVEAVRTEVESNMPFYLRLYSEAAERISAAAKAEADAWMTGAIHRAGLDHLRSLPAGAVIDAPAELPERAGES